MAALQQSRFSVYDLQGFRRTQESLDQLLIRKDYRLSEPTLQEKLTQPNKTLQKRKEELLTKACQELDLPSIIYEFKSLDLVNDKVAIEALARVAIQEQKNILDLMLSMKVNRKIADLLEKEAAQIFVYNEQLKNYHAEISEILAQEGREAFFRNQSDLTMNKMQLETQLFALRQNIHNESMAKLNDLFKQVDKLAKQYTDIQQMREQNYARHATNMSNNINNLEVDGQKVFTQEDNAKLIKLYDEKNELKNAIESIDEESKELVSVVQNLKQQRDDCLSEQNQIIQELGDQWIQSLEEDAQADIEEHILDDAQVSYLHDLDELSHEKDDLEEDLKSEMEKPDPKAKTQLMKKIEDISIKELRIQEKLEDLKSRKEEIAQKRQEKLQRFMDSSSNPAIMLMRVSKLKQLKAEEKKLNAQILQAEEKITRLETKREVLAEKFHGVIESIDASFDKAKTKIKDAFTSKRKSVLEGRPSPAMPVELNQKLKEVEKLEKDLYEESEISRQEGNAYAEQAAACKAQMHKLSACASAVAAVGADCDAKLGQVAPHSQHKQAAADYHNQENALKDKIKATVGAAVGASIGSRQQLRANNS